MVGLLVVGWVATDLEYHVHGWGLEAVSMLRTATLSPISTLLAKAASAGGFEIFLVAVPLLVWSEHPTLSPLGLRILGLLHYSLLFVSLLKTLFKEPRPIHLLLARQSELSEDAVHAGASSLDSIEYSFPSGHSWATTVAWLAVVDALGSRIPNLKLAAGVSVLATMTSRVYFALHFVHDVLVGSLLGVLTFASYASLQAHSLLRWSIVALSAATLMFAFDPVDRQRQLGAWYSLGAVVVLASLPPPPKPSSSTSPTPSSTPSTPSTSSPTPPTPPTPVTATLLAFVFKRAIVGLLPLLLGLTGLLARVVLGSRDINLEFIMFISGIVASSWVLHGAPFLFQKLTL